MSEHADQPLYRAYDTALLDLDGVVYAGPRAIDHAVESLAEARGAAASAGAGIGSPIFVA